MLIAPGNRHLPEILFNVLHDSGDNIWVYVGNLRVVHVPPDRALGSLYHAVGHAWIVGVESESTLLKLPGE